MLFRTYPRLSFLVLCGLAVITFWSLQTLIIANNVDVSEPLVRVPNQQHSQKNSCAACHQDVCDQFHGAPHSRTLLAVHQDQQILDRFAGRSYQLTPNGPMVSFSERDKQLWMNSEAYPNAIRIDWVFGSGEHAMTPISLLSNPNGSTELIEASVSWFPPRVLGLTPGADMTGSPGVGSLGNHVGHATTLECFGCHVTKLPLQNGKIVQDAIVQGVSCDRCHPGGDKHIQAMEKGTNQTMEKWSELTPLESINRCGECHRRADQLTQTELSPERSVLVRFASVGIAMSRCFLQQQDLNADGQTFRLDCLTCHDPHKPAEKSPEHYTSKCIHCHGPEKSQTTECSSEFTSGDCLTCHMPAVNITDNLRFTDHWIRRRSPADSESEDQKSQSK